MEELAVESLQGYQLMRRGGAKGQACERQTCLRDQCSVYLKRPLLSRQSIRLLY